MTDVNYEMNHESDSASNSSESEGIPGDMLDQYSYYPQPEDSSFDRDPSNAIPGSLHYVQHNAHVVQDPTGFGLIDESFLEDVPSTLTSSQLISYQSSFIRACRDYLQRLVDLRLTSFECYKADQDECKHRMEWYREVDFSMDIDEQDSLYDCHCSINSLGSQYRYFQRLIACAKQLKVRFDGNQHLVDQVNTPLMRATKRKVLQFKQDLDEISNWTRPGSLCQIDVLITQHDYEPAQIFIQQQEEIARQIAQRWL